MSGASNHPIQLKDVTFTKVHVEAMAGHKYSEGAHVGELENDLEVRADEETPLRYQAKMTTNINRAGDNAHPYRVEVECFCELTVDESLNKDEAHRGATITAHSVLYGAIRETIAWLTGRQPYGPIVLGLSVLAPKSKAIEDK